MISTSPLFCASSRRLSPLLAVAFAAMAAVASAQPPTIDAIPRLFDDPSDAESSAYDVSDDGEIVVGWSDVEVGISHAFRWTSEGGSEDLGAFVGAFPDESSSIAYAISGDGKTIVGHSSWNNSVGVFFERNGSLRRIPALAGRRYSSVSDVSDNGRVLIGETFDDGRGYAFRAKGNELTILGTIHEGFGGSRAFATSADGSVVVGISGTRQKSPHAFRWTAKNGMTDLGALDGTDSDSAAFALSSDGKIVVGRSGGAFLWTEEAGMQALPSPGSRSWYNGAFCVSDDGRVVGGESAYYGAGGMAFVWIDGQPQQLWGLLKRSGADLRGWTSLDELHACTPDGRTLVGKGRRSDGDIGFRVTLPRAPGPPPIADAGADRTIAASSVRGARVRLDGSKSFAPQGGALKYRWSGPNVQFVDPNVARPIARFPVGTTRIRLTVTDKNGLQALDTVSVQVKSKKAEARIQGARANDAFFYASLWAASSETNANAASAYGSLLNADRVALSVGDLISWAEDESLPAATVDYASLRSEQLRYGHDASQALLKAYAETGDEATLYAAYYAFAGVAYADADLSE